jgi:hypothetical protein
MLPALVQDSIPRKLSLEPWIIHSSGECKPWEAAHSRTIHDRIFWRHALASPVSLRLLWQASNL